MSRKISQVIREVWRLVMVQDAEDIEIEQVHQPRTSPSFVFQERYQVFKKCCDWSSQFGRQDKILFGEAL